MRIGYRKKVGKSGFYVRGSVSTKGIGKGLISILLSPFYLVYYVCVWPFVAIYKAITKKSRNKMETEKANAKALASRYMKIINDCSKLIAETKTPDVFFSRYDLLLETLSKFAQIEGVAPISNGSPSAELTRLSELREEATNDFIKRYAVETRKKIYELTTKSAKENRAESFKKILGEYSDKLTARNLDVIKSEYQKMLEHIGGKETMSANPE